MNKLWFIFSFIFGKALSLKSIDYKFNKKLLYYELNQNSC